MVHHNQYLCEHVVVVVKVNGGGDGGGDCDEEGVGILRPVINFSI